MYRQNFVAITFVITTIFVTSTVITSQGQYVAVHRTTAKCFTVLR